MEAYFKTENEYWNETLFGVYTDAIKSGLFEDFETPIKLYSSGVDSIYKEKESPVKVVELFLEELETLEPPKGYFILEKVTNYFKYTVFDEDGEEEPRKEVYTLLNSHLSRMKPQTPKVANLRETLKAIVRAEVEKLPETMKELEPAQRVNLAVKLMPFVLPRVESVDFKEGERNGLPKWEF